mgnify:CR=1 FL=1
MLTDEEWADIDSVDGWLFREEADLLARLSTSPWCEVGAWKGRATRVLARGGHGWVVDWFKGSSEHGPDVDTRPEFDENTAGLNITVLSMDFRAACDRIPASLQLLFLDAEHSYEATAEAFALFSPLVARTGLVVFHDAWSDDGGGMDGGMTPWPGVTRFVRNLDPEQWVNIENVARCAVFARA